MVGLANSRRQHCEELAAVTSYKVRAWSLPSPEEGTEKHGAWRRIGPAPAPAPKEAVKKGLTSVAAAAAAATAFAAAAGLLLGLDDIIKRHCNLVRLR